jgi:predicted SprT family Zn-dependent metalloprotease
VCLCLFPYCIDFLHLFLLISTSKKSTKALYYTPAHQTELFIVVGKSSEKFDLTGQRFGLWTVVKDVRNKGTSGRHFECICDCGNTKEVRGLDLRQGRSTRCVSCARIGGSTIDSMIGRKFGKWKVISFNGKKFKSYQYLCRCSCGYEAIMHGPTLRSGQSTQCQTCSNRIKSQNNATHGKSRSPLYKVWCTMKSRCSNPKDPKYQRYGGRGINVCDRWQTFENFHKDMSPRPNGMTLDRIDNNGPYCKENCRWVTIQENMRNRGYDDAVSLPSELSACAPS